MCTVVSRNTVIAGKSKQIANVEINCVQQSKEKRRVPGRSKIINGNEGNK